MLKTSIFSWSLAVILSIKYTLLNLSLHCWTVGGFIFLHITVIIFLQSTATPQDMSGFQCLYHLECLPGYRGRSSRMICLISTLMSYPIWDNPIVAICPHCLQHNSEVLLYLANMRAVLNNLILVFHSDFLQVGRLVSL